MELHEVKIGDVVTYKDAFKRNVVGKVIHRHDGEKNSALANHINVQKIGGKPEYPATLHVSKVKPYNPPEIKTGKLKTEETMESEQKTLFESIADMLADIEAGNNIDATNKFNDILSAKQDELLDAAKQEVASQVFNNDAIAEQDDDFIDDADEIEVLTQDQFDALSDEEKANYEMVELESDEFLTQDEFDALSDEEKANYEVLGSEEQVEEAYSDPYAAKKAAEMKKKRDEDLESAKKEYDETKESKGKVNTKTFMAKKKTNEETELEEGNAENKAKKNVFVQKLGNRVSSSSISRAHAQAGRKTLRNASPGSHESQNVRDAVSSMRKEEAENIDEVISAKTPTSEVIHDFVHSKNAKFKGKSTKERIRMALGAKYSMMRKEETEQLDEISFETKAAAYAQRRKKHFQNGAYATTNKHIEKANKTLKHIENKHGQQAKAMAVIDRDKYLKKEEVELEEASYSAKRAHAGKDLGKKGKNFAKIAKSAGSKYGSKASGERVAGAILKKLRNK